MTKRAVILHHVDTEKAGTILLYLKTHGIPYQTVDLFAPDHSLPPLDTVRTLIVMGGPMNVYQEDKFPFLKEENRYIQEAVKRGIPYLGVCLGSQLLAKALGARVYKAAQAEVGWDDVRLTADAEGEGILSGAGPKLRVLQWHEDTFDLPAGAVHLASSAGVPNQAYSVNGLFYGFQFHIEVDRAMLEQWFAKREDLGKILSEYDAYRAKLAGFTETIYRQFFALSAAPEKAGIR